MQQRDGRYTRLCFRLTIKLNRRYTDFNYRLRKRKKYFYEREIKIGKIDKFLSASFFFTDHLLNVVLIYRSVREFAIVEKSLSRWFLAY